MKNKANANPVSSVAEPVTPEVVASPCELEECNSLDAAERVRFHLSKAHVAASVALQHIIAAGQELAIQKQLLGYGQWDAWCTEKIEISKRTADKYIETFQKTVGAARLEQGVSLDAKLLKKELDAATVGMEEKTVRQAMLELGVIKRPSGEGAWGGAREGAGRKAAHERLMLPSAADNAKAIWAEVMRTIEKRTVKAAVAMLDAKTTEVCWGAVLELYEALKDHRAELART